HPEACLLDSMAVVQLHLLCLEVQERLVGIPLHAPFWRAVASVTRSAKDPTPSQDSQSGVRRNQVKVAGLILAGNRAFRGSPHENREEQLSQGAKEGSEPEGRTDFPGGSSPIQQGPPMLDNPASGLILKFGGELCRGPKASEPPSELVKHTTSAV